MAVTMLCREDLIHIRLSGPMAIFFRHIHYRLDDGEMSVGLGV